MGMVTFDRLVMRRRLPATVYLAQSLGASDSELRGSLVKETGTQ